MLSHDDKYCSSVTYLAKQRGLVSCRSYQSSKQITHYKCDLWGDGEREKERDCVREYYCRKGGMEQGKELEKES